MRRTLIVSIAALSLLAACSTSKDSGGTSSTAASATTGASTDSTPTDSTVAVVVDDRAPGVTADTIKIGVTYDDLTALKGIIGFDHGDYETAYGSLIDAINEAGGVHGRKIELVFAPVDPGMSDAASTACTKLTEDEGVFLTMGFFMTVEPLCYLDTHENIVIGGTQSPELMAQAKVLWLSTEGSSTQAVTGIQTLIDQGRFTDSLAVVGSSGDETLYNDSLKPLLDAAGIEPIEVAFVDSSNNDANAAYEASQTLAERFKADGATQILLIGTGAAAYFPVGLARTEYRPQLIFQSMAGAGTYTIGEGNDLSVMAGSITSGPFSTGDEFDTLTDEGTLQCLATQRAAGLTIVPEFQVPKGESKQATASLTACRNVTLLKAILELAGPDLNYGTFTTAAYSLGEIMLPGNPDPWFFGKDSPDGSPTLYVYEYDSTLKNMVRVAS